MSKTIFCFICKKPIDVQDDRAIAKLCPEHDTPENRTAMVNTPVKQLLSIQNEGLQLMLKDSEDATKLDIEKIMSTLKDLQKQVESLPKEQTNQETKETDNSLSGSQVNEYGEII